MKTKKELKFTNGWEKVPVWTEVGGEVVVDSTPIMKHIDVTYNEGELWYSENVTRRDEWIEWVDANLSKATIPILYGGLFSALKTTTRVSKLEKFGFFSKRIYAWMGFPIMWGFIARSRIKKDGRKPKQLWHDLLTEFTDEFRNLFDTSVALDEGNRLSINYESSGDLLKIIKALESTGSVTAEFEIKTPTMEDVFLKITGKRISIEGKIS